MRLICVLANVTDTTGRHIRGSMNTFLDFLQDTFFTHKYRPKLFPVPDLAIHFSCTISWKACLPQFSPLTEIKASKEKWKENFFLFCRALKTQYRRFRGVSKRAFGPRYPAMPCLSGGKHGCCAFNATKGNNGVEMRCTSDVLRMSWKLERSPSRKLSPLGR